MRYKYSGSTATIVEHLRTPIPTAPDFHVEDFSQDGDSYPLGLANIVPAAALGHIIHIEIVLNAYPPPTPNTPTFRLFKIEDLDKGNLSYKAPYPRTVESRFCLCFCSTEYPSPENARAIEYRIEGNESEGFIFNQIDLTVLGWYEI